MPNYSTPLPSRLGPCADFRHARRSKFCAVCGHTYGRHERPSIALPKLERYPDEPERPLLRRGDI